MGGMENIKRWEGGGGVWYKKVVLDKKSSGKKAPKKVYGDLTDKKEFFLNEKF